MMKMKTDIGTVIRLLFLVSICIIIVVEEQVTVSAERSNHYAFVSFSNRGHSLARRKKAVRDPKSDICRTDNDLFALQMNFGNSGNLRNSWNARKNIKMPLLMPVTADDGDDEALIPLPSCGEVELSSTHELTVSTAMHKLLIEHCVKNSDTGNEDEFAIPTDYNQKNPLFGHVAYVKGDASSLVGSIGCVSEILAVARNIDDGPQQEDTTRMLEFLLPQELLNDDLKDWTVLSRGNFRFIVKKMIQTYPFPIALVDELVDGVDPKELLQQQEVTSSKEDVPETKDTKDDNDDNNSVIEYNDFDDFQFFDDGAVSSSTEVDTNNDIEEDDDEIDDDPLYPDLDESQVLQRLVSSMNKMLQKDVDDAASEKSSASLLEKSIMEQYNVSNKARRAKAEENLATWQVFLSELLDIAPSKGERQYKVSMMAAELGQVSNEVRTKMLKSTDTVWRMRYVLQQVEQLMSMEVAKKLTQDIVKKTDEPYKQLKVNSDNIILHCFSEDCHSITYFIIFLITSAGW